MAQLTIHLNCRPRHGRMYVFLALRSDEDALPQEHEADHRRLLHALLPRAAFDGPNPLLVIERERPRAEPIIGGCGDDDGYEVIDIG